MSTRAMRKLVFVFVFLFLCSLAWGQQMHLTFVTKEPDMSLAISDISLRIAGNEVAIKDFHFVDTAKRDPVLLTHPAGRRQYILLIDLLYLTPSQALEARKLAQEFVAQVPKEDLIALAAITNTDGLRVFSNLTSDRSKLIAGWNAMGKIALSGWLEGPEGNLYTGKISADHKPLQLVSNEEFLANLAAYKIDKKVKDDLSPVFLQAFVDLSSLLSTITGRKNVIFFSPGANLKGLQVNLKETTKTEKDTNETGGDHKTLSEITEVRPRTLREMANQANQAQAPATTRRRENDAGIIPKLLEGTDSHVHVFNPSSQENGFLSDLVEKTKAASGTMQAFASRIPELLNSDRSFYVIGWEGLKEQTFHELRPIEIKLKNGDIIAPTRWLVPKPVADYSPLEKKAHLAQAIYKSFDRTDGHKFWSDFTLDELKQVSCFTEVPGSSIIGSASKKLLMEFYGFAIQSDGTIVDFYHLPVSLDLTNASLKERLKKAGLKVWNVLFANKGPLNVRTIVFNTESGQTITHSSLVQFSDGEFQVTNPFFPSYNFNWVLWPKPDEVLQRRGKEILYPYRVGENIFTPELSPRFQAAEKGKVIYFKMYNFTAEEKPSVRFRLLGDNGNSIEIEKFGLMQQPRLVQNGAMEVFWRIESIPPSLTKGAYRFQINVTDRSKNKEVIRDVPASVD